MPFFVYGRDRNTGAPARIYSAAATEEAARAQALGEGMLIDSIVPYAANAAPPALTIDYSQVDMAAQTKDTSPARRASLARGLILRRTAALGLFVVAVDVIAFGVAANSYVPLLVGAVMLVICGLMFATHEDRGAIAALATFLWLLFEFAGTGGSGVFSKGRAPDDDSIGPVAFVFYEILLVLFVLGAIASLVVILMHVS